MTEHHDSAAFEQGVMVDVGGAAGALLVYASADLEGHEIEISPHGDDTNRTHTEVLRRATAAGHVYAAIFGSLPAGRYRLWHESSSLPTEVLIVGGEIAEVHWP